MKVFIIFAIIASAFAIGHHHAATYDAATIECLKTNFADIESSNTFYGDIKACLDQYNVFDDYTTEYAAIGEALQAGQVGFQQVQQCPDQQCEADLLKDVVKHAKCVINTTRALYEKVEQQDATEDKALTACVKEHADRTEMRASNAVNCVPN